MKKMIFIMAALMSMSAFADSVTTRVGAFKGKLTVAAELDVKKVDVVIRNQFCNFWGTTCAGGPSDIASLPILVTESTDGKTISFENAGNEQNSSLKVGNRFSSCNVDLYVEAINSKGQILRGSKSLLWKNDKELCTSRERVTAIVKESLSKPLSLSEGFNYISIK